VGWLLPVTSLYNPFHALHWIVPALDSAQRAGHDGAVDIVVLLPTVWAVKELGSGSPLPMRELARLLADEVVLASETDECFARLRVGRGHLLDSTRFALPASPRHFLAVAAAAHASIPRGHRLGSDVLIIQRNVQAGRYVTGLDEVIRELERAHGRSASVLHDGPGALFRKHGSGLEQWAGVAHEPPLQRIAKFYRSSARVLVGAHGGGLAFAVFLKRPSAVVELSPPVWPNWCLPGWGSNAGSIYGLLCAEAGVDHACVMAAHVDHLSPDVLAHLDMHSNISIPPARVVRIVLEALALPPPRPRGNGH